MNNNLDRLIIESLLIEEEEAKKVGALGFMPKALVQVTLPHRQIKECAFVRTNGNFSITIMSPPVVGLPYGSVPRLLISWIATEAIRTKNRIIYFGNSLSDFMSKLDLTCNGGEKGNISRVKDQMRRLFSSSITCSYKDKVEMVGGGFTVATKFHVWWDAKNPTQINKDSFIELNDTFFDSLLNSPVPIDLRALKTIKQSPLAIDIYCWLTYRMSYLRKKTQIPWDALQMQFGANYSNEAQGKRDFKKAFIRELKKIHLLYPSAKIDANSEFLILEPSNTHISSNNTKLIT